jgi:hypothetical protein
MTIVKITPLQPLSLKFPYGPVLVYIISHITCPSPFAALMSTPGFVPSGFPAGMCRGGGGLAASCERCLNFVDPYPCFFSIYHYNLHFCFSGKRKVIQKHICFNSHCLKQFMIKIKWKESFPSKSYIKCYSQFTFSYQN